MSNINLFDPSAEDANGKSLHPENKLEDLIVFGYSCKLFRDDFSAKAIDRGQSLIPWNGDENVMIDRYDCRSHLFDLTPWDSDLIRNRSNHSSEDFLDENERKIEDECDQERYLDLYRDVEKDLLEQEEKAKRLAAEKSSYGQVGFNYDETNQTKEPINTTNEEPPPPPVDDDEYEPFYPSEKLQIPYGMDIPESIKLNAVIEKTASFVSSSGLQMEIVLKTKQANNPQFDFLKYDHYLNPYYRHLILMIKSGKYRPNLDSQQSTNSIPKKKSSKNGVDQNSSHDEDEGGDSYLHPLLRGGGSSENLKKNDETIRIPSIPMNIHNTPYGQLIKKYEHLRQQEKPVKETEEEKTPTGSDDMKNEDSSSLPSESSPSPSPSTTTVIPPPPDVKPIIDKLAEYVARNGSTFEKSIRAKNDPRFGFLDRDHIHHNYYLLKVQLCFQEIQRKAAEETPAPVHGQGVKLVLKSNAEVPLRDFQSDEDSNSMPLHETGESGEFIGPRPPSPEFLEKMRKQEQRRDRAMEFVREKLLREKQEERKRKAELLIQQLKTKPNETSSSSSASLTVEPSTTPVNPVLVEKLLNVKSERSSSSLVASPHHQSSRSSRHSRSTSKSRSRSKYHRRSRSRSNHRRSKRSSHKRSRTRSKSRSRYRSKRSKNSKSSRDRRHRRRRHRRTSSKSSSRSRSRSSRSSSRSSNASSSSSSNDRKRQKKIPTLQNESQTQSKKNPQSSKWDQREPIKVKTETTPSTDNTNETSLTNSNLS